MFFASFWFQHALTSLYQTFSLKLMKEDFLQIVEKFTFNQPLGFIPWRKMRSKLYWTFSPNNWSLMSKHQVCTTRMAHKLFFEGFHFAHHSQCVHTYFKFTWSQHVGFKCFDDPPSHALLLDGLIISVCIFQIPSNHHLPSLSWQ